MGELIESMWKLMIEYEEIQRGKSADKEYIKKELLKYDSLWKEWKSLKDNNECCATIYTDMAFRNDKKGSIGELADKMRKIISTK